MVSNSLAVVIPTHFRDPYLAEALASIRDQTVPVTEIIVVNDGGHADTEEVVKRVASNARYIWQTNAGVQVARNTGTSASSSEWIAFLDDDDAWEPRRHELLQPLLASDAVDLIAGDFVKFGEGWIDEKGQFERHPPSFWRGYERATDEVNSIVGHFPALRIFPVSPFWPSTLVFRRRLIDSLGGWTPALRRAKTEDQEVIFRALQRGQLGLLWSPTVRYRVHTGNDSSDDYKNAIGRVEVWKYMLDNVPLAPEERDHLDRVYRNGLHEALRAAYALQNPALVRSFARAIGLGELSRGELARLALSALPRGARRVVSEFLLTGAKGAESFREGDRTQSPR